MRAGSAEEEQNEHEPVKRDNFAPHFCYHAHELCRAFYANRIHGRKP